MFAELLDNSRALDPGLLQSQARVRFPDLLSGGFLELRDPTEEIPSSTDYVIIGVASYSRQDLKFLDEVVNAHPHELNALVRVFDVAALTTQSEIAQYVPPFHSIQETPIISIWRHGTPVEARSGLAQVERAWKAFIGDHAEIC